MQWLSGRVLESIRRGRGFEPHRRHCIVSLSKNIYPSLVLVQPRKTRPYITERLLMGRKESNQIKQNPCFEGVNLGIQRLSVFLAAGSTVGYLTVRGILYMYWDSVLVLVTSCSSTQKPEVWRGLYSYHGMHNTKRNAIGLLSSVLEGFPRKALGHSSDTAGAVMVSCHKSDRSPLDSFTFLMSVVWILDCGRIFHLRP